MSEIPRDNERVEVTIESDGTVGGTKVLFDGKRLASPITGLTFEIGTRKRATVGLVIEGVPVKLQAPMVPIFEPTEVAASEFPGVYIKRSTVGAIKDESMTCMQCYGTFYSGPRNSSHELGVLIVRHVDSGECAEWKRQWQAADQQAEQEAAGPSPL